MRFLLMSFAVLLGLAVYAQQEAASDPLDETPVQQPEPLTDGSREPAAATVPATAKVLSDSDELRVQTQLPEAKIQRDTKTVQKEVFKTIYNQELKPDQREDALEE